MDASKPAGQRSKPAPPDRASADRGALDGLLELQGILERIKGSLDPDGQAPAGEPSSVTPADPVEPAPAPEAASPSPAAPRYQTKFDYLLTRGWLTPDELEAALTAAKRAHTDPESILVEEHNVPKAEVGASLAAFYRCPFVEFDPRVVIPRELLKGLKTEFLKANTWVPLRRGGRREGDPIVVLVDDPHDLQKVDSIERLLHTRRLSLEVGLRKDILRFIAVATSDHARGESVADIIGTLSAEETAEAPAEDEQVDENDSAIVRLANQIILSAHRARASDIHIEPYGPQQDTHIRFRVDGICTDYQTLPGGFRRPLVARLKIMARLDIAERRKPQDGKIKVRLGEREIELRVVTIPTVGSEEDIVLRLLTSTEPIPIDRLGMTERNLRELKRLADKPYGLILCVGPTGSGKTTTLHSILGYLNRADKKIWTAEDPVEITQHGLRQVQVNPKIGLTFATALRSFLRADPDIIMVGEMRDAETAAVGIESSLTGHLVLSTLHTNSAVETITRLLDMGLDPFAFADSLLGIVGQRLVRRLCAKCGERYRPSEMEYEDLARTYGIEEWEKLGIPYNEDFALARARGCADCNGMGYFGRAGIHELLMASPDIKRLAQTGARGEELLGCARAEGMTTLLQDGVLKALKGVTDLKQVKAAALR